MILRNFREEYSKALQELPEFHMDVSQIRSKEIQVRMARARRRKMLIPAVSAACIFLMCGVGAAAMNYQSSRIQVERNGFSFLGQGVAPDGEAAGGAASAGGAALSEGGASQAETAEDTGVAYALNKRAEEEGFPEAQGESAQDGVAVAQIVAEVDCTDITYDSIEEFRRCEDMVIAIPEAEWLGDPEELEDQFVTVNMMHVMVSMSFGEKRFFMSQADNREFPNYASSSVFMGDAANERTLTNDQGMTYTLFDSVEEDQVVSTHAALSANGRDIIYTFFGYESEEVDAVLKQLDVSIYFREE